MTRDHAIRVAVGHLKNEARQEAIMDFLKHPEKLSMAVRGELALKVKRQRLMR